MLFKVFVLIFTPILVLAEVGVLKKVVDGDTVYFNVKNKTIKCRVAYIDTPEKSFNNKLKSDIKRCGYSVSEKDMKSAGKSATRAAKRLLKVKKQYSFKVIDKDRYKRSICIIDLNNGMTFNDQMVLNGYAIPYWKYIPSSKKSHFKNLMNRAKSNGSGLWGSQKEVMECLD